MTLAQVKAARSRCLVVANIIEGQSLADACANSGFVLVKAFVQSCKAARFFPALREARKAAIMDCGTVEQARTAQRRYALQAAQAIKQLRYLGAWQWDCERFGVPPASGGAGVIAFRRLLDIRARAVALAKHYKAVAARAMVENLAMFDKVLVGIHSERLGDLRRVFGLVDKRGRVGAASKVNPAMLRRGRGKVASRVKLAHTIPLPVGRANRALPCAVGSDAKVSMDGRLGWIMRRSPAARG